ncbi:Transcription factor like [Actinidia chinensis var. chinensis]|uniref:Transcription factor like n=1 Tax=Actinidia chinensis var. chinensis TaxID=1590841 RepID=A0A2R6RJI8_ACTCC|nr:Transcription factor like [Actinidia chinensis var. chinensis]
MSEASRDLGASAEPNKVGPDCFSFYTHEVAELLSQDDDFLPLSSETSELVGRTSGVGGDRAISRHNYSGKDKIVLGSLFCNPTGARLSDIKKERLKALLRQSVIALSQEVDEMLDPVLGIHRILSHLKYRKSLSNYSGVACEGDTEQHPQKKIKLSTSISIPPHASPASSVSAEIRSVKKPGKVGQWVYVATVISLDLLHAYEIYAPLRTSSSHGSRKSLSNYSGVACEGDTEQHPQKKIKLSTSISIPPHASPASSVSAEDSDSESSDADFPKKVISNGVTKSNAHYHATETSKWGPGPEGPEVNDDLQFLLENDALKVKESIKKHSDELSTTLGHMEQLLEVILDTVVSNCRLMTLTEKQQLQRLIQKLPPRNLDRVVEIIRHDMRFGRYSSDEIYDNTTLWRLHYYVEAIENARKLPGVAESQQTL